MINGNYHKSVLRATWRERPDNINTDSVEGVSRQDELKLVLAHAGTLDLAFMAGGEDIRERSFHSFPVVMFKEPVIRLVDATMAGIAVYLQNDGGLLTGTNIGEVHIIWLS